MGGIDIVAKNQETIQKLISNAKLDNLISLKDIEKITEFGIHFKYNGDDEIFLGWES